MRTKTIPADLYNVSIHLFNCPAFSKVPAKKKKGGGGAICFKLVLARKEPFDSVFKSVRQDKERSSL